MFDSFEDSIFLVFVLSWLLNVNGSNGIEKCDGVTYWLQILSDHLGIEYSKIKDVGRLQSIVQEEPLSELYPLCYEKFVPKCS